MPKAIEKAEETILQSTEKIILEKGYDATDMRSIAAECRMAVGTLYNYYSDKSKIFEALFDHTLDELLGELDEIVNGPLSPKEKIYRYLEKTYGATESKRSIWDEAYRRNLTRVIQERRQRDEDDLMRMDSHARIAKGLRHLITQAKESEGLKYSSAMERRLARLLLDSVGSVTAFAPHEKSQNLRFLRKIVDVLFSTPCENEQGTLVERSR